MTRETTSSDWADALDVGNVTTVKLDTAKDNTQFGLRAVDQAGESLSGCLRTGVTA